MINFVDKGFGLFVYLEKNGVFLEELDGVWTSPSNHDLVNQLIDEYNPWPTEKAKKLAEINEWLENQLQLVVAGIPESEQKSWPTQVDEAYGKRPLRMLLKIAEMRGITTEALIAKVKAKAEAFEDYYGTMQGLRDKAEQQIKSMPDSGEFHRLPELWAIKCTG